MLKSAWVDRIHARILVRYGAAWLRMWEGIDQEAVKADWAEELDGLSADSLAYALDHLPPDRPPTVAQFKAIALARVPAAAPALPAPKADPARVAEIVSGIARPAGYRHPKQWARDLLDRQKSGERIPIAHLTMARAALEFEPAEQGSEWQ